MNPKIMKVLAKEIEDTFENEYEEFNEVGKGFSPELDVKLLQVARFYDKRYAIGRKKQKSRKVLQKVAVFLIIFLSVNSLAIGISHAYRQFVFQVFENEENNSITIHNAAELDMISSWVDYWYPTYLPVGYQITYAEEDPVKCFLIQPTDGTESLIITEYPKGSEISYDSKHSQISNIRIHNYIGKRLAFDNHTIIVYPTETITLEFSFDVAIPEQEVVKIAENMEYIE
ncbi:MAG: DUF4367 domain-containing protein [Clostridia bacterium]|nr:DUF4367 domain-containing protein [Clostridia bacterium]